MSKTVLVTGGAGFLGSHTCDALITRGDEVICLDDLSTGSMSNIEHLLDHPRFLFVRGDVTAAPKVPGSLDAILHMACPASPPDYLARPLETLAIGSRGSEFVLEMARAHGCRVLLTSTSEVYGDPLVHPQEESYWGNVNPVGPRSVYDESKRFAEAMFMAHHRTHGVDIAIVRIFNTYGPRLRPRDGRVVSNFIAQALTGEPITVYGDGQQTRSFCYVSDLVRGLLVVLDGHEVGPLNLGNPAEVSVLELADLVIDLTGSSSPVVHELLPVDDPTRRRPDISLIQRSTGWGPRVALQEGLLRTIEWQRSEAGVTRVAAVA